VDRWTPQPGSLPTRRYGPSRPTSRWQSAPRPRADARAQTRAHLTHTVTDIRKTVRVRVNRPRQHACKLSPSRS
jgi:hypothetical protein